MIKSTTQRTFSYFAPKLYNKLPDEVKLIQINKILKIQIRKYIEGKPRHIFDSILDNYFQVDHLKVYNFTA